MKTLSAPSSLGIFLMLILPGCTGVSKMAGSNHPKVFSNILVIYEDDPCDPVYFDSVSYQLCFESLFKRTDDFAQRQEAEERLQEDLWTSKNTVLLSTNYFNASNYSFAYFNKLIDSLGVDGILLVDYLPINETGPADTSYNIKVDFRPTGGIARQREKTIITPAYDANFAQYSFSLLQPGLLAFPVWKATAETSKPAKTDKINIPPVHMIRKVTDQLKKDGYIVGVDQLP